MVLHANQTQESGSGNGVTNKAWTVMIYLAADTVLTNFAVESLKQMKASQDPRINIVVEFDSGRCHSTERYFFGELPHGHPKKNDEDQMKDRLNSISNNIVMRLEAQEVGEPVTLTNFIDWSVREYPADHYFLIIWGHGSGIDDSIPRAHDRATQEALEQDRTDRFFISHHRPLPTAKVEFTEAATKSLAFVDRPISYLTNAGLRMALQDAQRRLSKWPAEGEWTLDLLGMDACNMNLIELGYELRDFADYMVASQDEIPDASWPYFQILQELAEEVGKRQEEQKSQKKIHQDKSSDIHRFVRKIAQAYTNAYQDYVDQPVALSVLKLTRFRDRLDHDEVRGDKIRRLFKPLTDILQLHSTHRDINDAIVFARKRVRSFYTHLPAARELHTRDIYIDLIHFCKLLSLFLKGHKQQPQIEKFISQFELCSLPDERIEEERNNETTVITVNERSRNEEECNGTSIYFPATPQDEFGAFYEELEFAQDTVWPAFVSDFLQRNPDILILPKFDLRNGHVKGNPNDAAKGNPNDGTKFTHRIIVPEALPLNMTADPCCEEKINPAICNVVYNNDTIIEMGCDQDL